MTNVDAELMLMGFRNITLNELKGLNRLIAPR